MSTDEQDLLYGSTNRRLKEARRKLACLKTKRDLWGEILRRAADRLYEPYCHGPRSLIPDLPTNEERCDLVNAIEAAAQEVSNLDERLREMEP